jgi:tetratricopeptide (TPR) repeat protein
MSSSQAYDLSKAEAAFKQGNYDITRTELSSYLSANPTDTLALLFQGICQLELDNYSQAATIFSEIKSGTSDFQSLGEWYLALSFVKQKDFDRARQELENIPQGSEKYAEAQELLNSLKE